MKTLKFTKMVATGNDFILVDNRRPYIAYRMSYVARKLCDRKKSIGADGLLVLERSGCADFKMRILNPDGSEPAMCGNGSRCIALYAKLNRIAPSSMTIETGAGLLHAEVRSNTVKINMTEPRDLRLGLKIRAGRGPFLLHYINTGVPHAVCLVKDAGRADVFNIGRKIRYHNRFMPEGTNVDFVEAKGRNSIFMRTYERGVEAETLACGTGAVASAIISGIIKGYPSPVKVYTQGGLLKIYFTREGRDRFGHVYLEGEAREVFKGELKVSGSSGRHTNPQTR